MIVTLVRVPPVIGELGCMSVYSNCVVWSNYLELCDRVCVCH